MQWPVRRAGLCLSCQSGQARSSLLPALSAAQAGPPSAALRRGGQRCPRRQSRYSFEVPLLRAAYAALRGRAVAQSGGRDHRKQLRFHCGGGHVLRLAVRRGVASSTRGGGGRPPVRFATGSARPPCAAPRRAGRLRTCSTHSLPGRWCHTPARHRRERSRQTAAQLRHLRRRSNEPTTPLPSLLRSLQARA